MSALKLIVTGAMGRLGQALVRYIAQDESCELLGATERHDHPSVAADLGALLLGGSIGIHLENDLRNVILGADAIIDFTLPEATLTHAEIAANKGVPIVIGTTGLTAAQREKVVLFAEKIPIVLAPNMSVGMNLLFFLTRRVAQVLDVGYDVELVEVHHRHKVDAPSGTALRLAEVVAETWGHEEDPRAIFDYGRAGNVGERDPGRIGIHAVRGGDIVGRHQLSFYGSGEVVTLGHEATSRDNFVKGAIRAAHWIVKQAPGLYDMGDVLGLS